MPRSDCGRRVGCTPPDPTTVERKPCIVAAGSMGGGALMGCKGACVLCACAECGTKGGRELSRAIVKAGGKFCRTCLDVMG